MAQPLGCMRTWRHKAAANMQNETDSRLLQEDEFRSSPSTQRSSIKRILLAILAGYLTNASLIAGAEYVLIRVASGPMYFVADVMTQCLVQIGCGYICCRISNATPAIAGLVALGLLVGGFSLTVSWETEPHWYGIALLVVYGPSIWVGYRLANRRS
jgi:hypothetical protein